MELLKSDPILDHDYLPNLELGYLEYFNRALSFSQTNYSEYLTNLSRRSLVKLTPTTFIDRYIEIVLMRNNTQQHTVLQFKKVKEFLTPHYYKFWDTSTTVSAKNIATELSLCIDADEAIAIGQCIQIVHRGIKLFNWVEYKTNYLHNTQKLKALPFLNDLEVKLLARNIGASPEAVSYPLCQKLAVQWNFGSAIDLYKAIQVKVPLQLRIIEAVFYYSAMTFNDSLLLR